MPNSTRAIPRCQDGKTYNQGCRCSFCKHQAATLNAMYRFRKMERARGRHDPLELVDSRESRLLVRAALRRGISSREIERLTGLRRLTIQRLARGEVARVRLHTAVQIARFLTEKDGPRDLNPSSLVPVARGHQIVRSLLAQGWPGPLLREILARERGVGGGFIEGLANQDPNRGMIRWENLQHLVWLAGFIGDRQGPSVRTRNWWTRRGHFPLKHYDGTGQLMVATLSREQRAQYEGV